MNGALNIGLLFFLSSCFFTVNASEGVFHTDFGETILIVNENSGDIRGTYPKYKGQLAGRVTTPGAAMLYWFQPISEQKCKTAKHGTLYWGTVNWQLSQSGKLTGDWSYCNASPGSGGQWNGNLKSGELAFSIKQPVTNIVTATEVTREEAMHELRIQGGQMALRLPYSMHARDVTCDNIPDQVVGWLNLDNPDGPFYYLMIVTRHNGSLHSELAFFDYANTQNSLCPAGKIKAPDIRFEDYRAEPGEVNNMVGYTDACGLAVVVDDGACDAHRIFWRHNNPNEQKLLRFRN